VIKALAIGLGLVLGAGVVHAQAKKAAPKRKAPAAAPRSGDKQPTPTPTTPDATPAPTTGDARPADALPPTPAPASPTPDARGPATPAKAAGTGRDKPAPMKTDEKAGPNEVLPQSGNTGSVSKINEECALREFHAGNDNLNNGLFPPAVARYKAAIACWDHPAIHYNLALALINLDQPIDVFEHVNLAMQYGSGPLGQDKFDHAREYLKLVAGQLADIEVSCNKVGAKIAVDGKEVFTAPGSYKAKVRVGKHTFFGEKEGYNARVTAPFIGPGETFRIELKLYTIPELTRYRCKWGCDTRSGYYVLGGGILAGIAGGIFTWRSQSDYQAFDTAVLRCQNDAKSMDPTSACKVSSNLTDMRASGDTKKTLSYVGYGVAGAAVATGAVLLWLNRREAYQIRPEELDEEKAERASVTVVPLVSPDAAGAMVLGRF
jgi:hypothetical protein